MLFLEQTQGFRSALAGGDASPPAPSLFELHMQDRMAAGLKPALEYVAQTLCDSYPQLSTAWPLRHVDESYALLRLLIERYFLLRYDALASERFYGMKRVLLHAPTTESAAATTSPLTKAARRQSLLLAVLLPYVKAKLDHLYHGLQQTPQQQQPASERRSQDAPGARFLRRWRQLGLLARLRAAFVKTYPVAHMLYEMAFFVHQWLYLFGVSPHFSPLLRRVGAILVRVTPEDESALVQGQTAYRERVLASLKGPGALLAVRRALRRTAWAVYDHSSVLLVLGLASYKFLEWMYSDDGVATKVRLTGTDAPIPPPPLPPSAAGNAAVLLSTLDAATCPLCQRPRVNPAASVAGIVCCYPCLYRHVEAHGACPVTGMRCDVSSIVKIYDDAQA
ncbi:hypothetical protein P43SY_000054 [Pythium insidiosum]|uniref:Peroxisome assembly protein 12 n=1 Tax=Pythium insidiosum TaxID=114742 RepID=A0AAD5LV18_PYTIN|nr:hypothetical protein P43SY_000054 [Pythium insidiosum]